MGPKSPTSNGEDLELGVPGFEPPQDLLEVRAPGDDFPGEGARLHLQRELERDPHSPVLVHYWRVPIGHSIDAAVRDLGEALHAGHVAEGLDLSGPSPGRLPGNPVVRNRRVGGEVGAVQALQPDAWMLGRKRSGPKILGDPDPDRCDQQAGRR